MSEQTIRVLVVDDEEEQLERMRAQLTSFINVEVDATIAANEVLSMLMKRIYDLLLIDLDLGFGNLGVDGIVVASQALAIPLPDYRPRVAFFSSYWTRTGYPQLAMGIQDPPLHLLEKPVSRNELQVLLDRVRQRTLVSVTPEDLRCLRRPGVLPTLDVRTGLNQPVAFLPAIQAVVVYTKDRMVRVGALGGDYECVLILDEIQKRFADYSFLRVHKSFVVNLNHVIGPLNGVPGRHGARLPIRKNCSGLVVVPVGESYLSDVTQRLEALA